MLNCIILLQTSNTVATAHRQQIRQKVAIISSRQSKLRIVITIVPESIDALVPTMTAELLIISRMSGGMQQFKRGKINAE